MECGIESDRLAAFLDGTLEEPERQGVEAHVTACGDCSRTVSAVVRSGRLKSSEIVQEQAQTSKISSWKPVVAAAGLLLAAGIAVWGVSRTGPKESMEFGVSKGVSVRLSEDGKGEWDRSRRGEAVFRLDAGEIHADVGPGEERFAVRTPAGEVRVLGTRFSVRLIDLPVLEEETPPRKGGLVELQNGKLELANEKGTARIEGTRRGVLVPGFPPYGMLERPALLPEREFNDIWNNRVRAVERKDADAAGFFTAVLVSHGEAVRPYLESLVNRSAPSAEWAENVLQIIGEKR